MAGSRTLPPCATETPTGLGQAINNPDTPAAFSEYQPFKTTATTLGVSNSSFLIQSVNSSSSFEYSGNTFLGWINQAMYNPYNCRLACNALNATGIRCNSYNTCECSLPSSQLPLDLPHRSAPSLPPNPLLLLR